ncbi:hypothetical protein YC2023_104062 [Brassica napus]
MEVSSVDESTTSTCSIYETPAITPAKTSVNLHRMGSGSSVVLDAENGAEAESRKLPSSKSTTQNDGVSTTEFRSAVSLFEKAVTPSDVGKLNRLVIPKHHAEKYFPLPPSSNVSVKGVLLNFEDVAGKVWRFRYSYWNSSQSYVLTKGWSRFVKEKNLRAGDVVSFSRSDGQDQQLYIGWKSRSGSDVETGRVLRLFGVNVSPAGSRNDVVGNKRVVNDTEMLSLVCSKKQRIFHAL